MKKTLIAILLAVIAGTSQAQAFIVPNEIGVDFTPVNIDNFTYYPVYEDSGFYITNIRELLKRGEMPLGEVIKHPALELFSNQWMKQVPVRMEDLPHNLGGTTTMIDGKNYILLDPYRPYTTLPRPPKAIENDLLHEMDHHFNDTSHGVVDPSEPYVYYFDKYIEQIPITGDLVRWMEFKYNKMYMTVEKASENVVKRISVACRYQNETAQKYCNRLKMALLLFNKYIDEQRK